MKYLFLLNILMTEVQYRQRNKYKFLLYVYVYEQFCNVAHHKCNLHFMLIIQELHHNWVFCNEFSSQQRLNNFISSNIFNWKCRQILHLFLSSVSVSSDENEFSLSHLFKPLLFFVPWTCCSIRTELKQTFQILHTEHFCLYRHIEKW